MNKKHQQSIREINDEDWQSMTKDWWSITKDQQSLQKINDQLQKIDDHCKRSTISYKRSMIITQCRWKRNDIDDEKKKVHNDIEHMNNQSKWYNIEIWPNKTAK